MSYGLRICSFAGRRRKSYESALPDLCLPVSGNGLLQHERIPHLISAFEEEQYRCILMEYIPGVSLSRIQGCSSEQKRLQWCLQLGELLQYLHEQQIVHLDIKPSNLQYWKGNVYLLDFATSRFLQEQDVAAAVSPRLFSQRGWYAEL